MRMSTKSRYGARAVIEIAKAYREGTQVKRKEISARQLIPDSYLENILVTLKAAGIIITSRGANGGYQLSRSPETITLLEVVTALEGHLTPVPCIDSDSCELLNECTTRDIWIEMYRAMEKVLDSYSLQDIIERERRQEPFVYVI